MHTLWKSALGASLVAMAALTLPHSARAVHAVSPPHRFDGTLAVLTYNIKGLPWPVARGRTAALARIADRLGAMRETGREPQVVLLQEAFTGEARSIGQRAGYPYVVSGPAAADAGSGTMTGADRRFAADARWWKGETEGKLLGSGLEILSDYPVVAVRRLAFPAFACAGFDCLANKGALLVSLAIPGVSAPVDVLTTHLNSRHASGVDDARSNYAYRRQVAALTAFVRTAHDPARPLIAAGDFNLGWVAPRRAALLTQVREEWSPAAPVRDALGQYRRQGGLLSPDAAFSAHRARDWQFYADGATSRLILTGIDVPFGTEPSGGMLSDHVGYVARFRIQQDGLPPAGIIQQADASGLTRPARSRA
ncbi:endonuclease/exonuclease/phosphatase family protein [Flavisphingomonas formosensis]|uniref:endonuclease/exonuclease/phosphatase family protein n=1 Tax=Flavisphingomonas formosensis TaxID=861534 RepID=UPI0012FA9EA2|nr:endonuclease/exonuclease/phosphatase family protein [Sphingomonas formosensis]